MTDFYDTEKSILIIIIPICWGIWEFRQFRLQTNKLQFKINELDNKFNDICKNRLDNYPFLNHISLFIQKANTISDSWRQL